ncbi:DUF475 domain-containing protein [Fangia hongkongensis]|uniref:DUF475 domain-containing protein n=1 Tax=Fangia hongkongensis TaxID=270495 RepID=UPI000373E2CD|nr:DUF475 domain-containing protein [Fangia hongkongensis]MBK2124173.1 DUF475 domain-containing protein [Fangia hongkongensis]
MRNLKYFYSSFIVTIIGIIAAVMLEPEHKIYALYLIIVLALLEVSLSFDNAVVNAKVLNKMPKKWQKIFIWIGLPIAVFGMRLIFPILLVSVTTSLSFVDVFRLAVNNPDAYQSALELGFPTICAFGGGFLIMVFLKFFIAEKHEIYWLHAIEKNRFISALRNYPGGYIIIALIIGYTVLHYASDAQAGTLAMAFLMGLMVHEALGILNSLFGGNMTGKVMQNGLMGFIYLEVLDASFSFDGVIGAFAISTNIFIIMIGLGIGAMFVRSLTIFFVEHQTLSKFRYLEHGAHYAIGFLAIIMFIKIYAHVPEWLTGTIGIGLIIIAFIHSIRANKKDALIPTGEQ